MFEFILKAFFCRINNFIKRKFVSCNSTNQEGKVRPEIVNVNSHEAIFYLFSIKTSM